MSLAGWLDARDGESLESAWTTLAPTRVEVCRPEWWISAHGVAQFAAAFLGWPLQRVAWLCAPEDELPAPAFEVRQTVSRCFLDQAIDCRQEAFEEWQIRERVSGARGVQHIKFGFRYDDGSREGSGGSATVVRVFDRDAGVGVSIHVPSQSVWTIGEIDLGRLDLFRRHSMYRLAWTQCDLDGVRGFLAQVASEVDAHFDVSSAWPGRVVDRKAEREESWRFEAGAFAIDLDVWSTDTGGCMLAKLHGLPWGHVVEARIDHQPSGVEGTLDLQLPLALGDALLARLASIPGVTVTC